MRELSLQSATLPGIRLGADTVEDITCEQNTYNTSTY